MPDQRLVYVCPHCKTRIPFGTETYPPPSKCPGCQHRLDIPTVMPHGSSQVLLHGKSVVDSEPVKLRHYLPFSVQQMLNRFFLPALFAVTMFVSAGLLFCVQPMVAKMILLILGGSPAVWIICMLFFQAVLLAGYLRAHGVWSWSQTR